MRDQYFSITTYVTGFGTAIVEMPTIGLTLEEVMEFAKDIEYRFIREGVCLIRPNTSPWGALVLFVKKKMVETSERL